VVVLLFDFTNEHTERRGESVFTLTVEKHQLVSISTNRQLANTGASLEALSTLKMDQDM